MKRIVYLKTPIFSTENFEYRVVLTDKLTDLFLNGKDFGDKLWINPVTLLEIFSNAEILDEDSANIICYQFLEEKTLTEGDIFELILNNPFIFYVGEAEYLLDTANEKLNVNQNSRKDSIYLTGLEEI
jgi:hypothetical protein